tara:strand:+ start:2284 stop:2745 length:462 start_codon:yes stop_codon:yes gene_type:complete
MKYILPLAPVPAPRPRVTKWGTYYPKTYKTFLADCVTLLAALHKGHSIIEPASVEIDFYIKRPQRLMRKTDPPGRVIHDRKPDIDNLTKSVLDALTKSGIVLDDSRIAQLTARKFYSEKGIRPRIEIIIQTLSGHNDPKTKDPPESPSSGPNP